MPAGTARPSSPHPHTCRQPSRTATTTAMPAGCQTRASGTGPCLLPALPGPGLRWGSWVSAWLRSGAAAQAPRCLVLLRPEHWGAPGLCAHAPEPPGAVLGEGGSVLLLPKGTGEEDSSGLVQTPLALLPHRYPITHSRPGCYGDRNSLPGVRSYGQREADEAYDVYCYARELQGKAGPSQLCRGLALPTAPRGWGLGHWLCRGCSPSASLLRLPSPAAPASAPHPSPQPALNLSAWLHQCRLREGILPARRRTGGSMPP